MAVEHAPYSLASNLRLHQELVLDDEFTWLRRKVSGASKTKELVLLEDYAANLFVIKSGNACDAPNAKVLTSRYHKL